MNSKITLVSHHLCPYVQRAAILLAEKGIEFERKNVDLSNKPDWFLDISPLGKTPVLLVDSTPIFESAVICEYLDEVYSPALHPKSALEKARHRAWIEFGSSILNEIAGFYNAPDSATLSIKAANIRNKFIQLEKEVKGPYFEGQDFSIVDAVFGPVFRYFDAFESIADFNFFSNVPNITAWRQQLAKRSSVQQAVQNDYPDRLDQFLLNRNSELSRMMETSSEEALATA
ncbi:glutathione S-transferase [Hahella sp. CCB-MM4]|uniref:glutathione S-transferase family protein n=1 Tax=Hahella sp. (strain CCB-MM4) TaxID=1926491 RepID=UPI000B9C2753|nr:glutathione S-transferase family protein [Hahella sp. CCB-MM4]OZG71649.1 glutathione S-transferase [Hahella sp. CCB-MM4]